jgi:hypothetical protein
MGRQSLVVLEQSKRRVKSATADQPRDDDSIPIAVKDGGIAHVATAAENTNSDPWICVQEAASVWPFSTTDSGGAIVTST